MEDSDNLIFITASDGEGFSIPRNDPNFHKLCQYAEDSDARKKLTGHGFGELGLPEEKAREYYLRFKKDYLPEKTEITEQHRQLLEQKPTLNTLGTGKQGEELAQLIEKYHR